MKTEEALDRNIARVLNQLLKDQLKDQVDVTEVTITQGNNASEEEKAHSEKNWQTVLERMKKLLEG
jgi:hypothetical protein